MTRDSRDTLWLKGKDIPKLSFHDNGHRGENNVILGLHRPNTPRVHKSAFSRVYKE